MDVCRDARQGGMDQSARLKKIDTTRSDFNTGTLAADFCAAGGSAFLLLIARLLTDYWFVGCIGLIPVLHRMLTISPRRAAVLGGLFGLSFFGIALINNLPISPLLTFGKIIGGTLVFAGFGWASSLSRRWCGANPLVVALLWVAAELPIIYLGFTDGLLGGGQYRDPLFGGIAALFGFVLLSFLIVLFDAIVVIALERVTSWVRTRETNACAGERNWDLPLIPGFLAAILAPAALGRAPPSPLQCQLTS